MEVLIKGEISLNGLVGISSKIQVDGLEETFAVSSESSCPLLTPNPKCKLGSKDTPKNAAL